MTTWAYEFPAQIQSALDQVEDLSWSGDGEAARSSGPCFIAGMGGSGAAGRLAGAALAAAESELPLWVQSDPSVPDWVSSSTPAGVMSYSGNTWESLVAFEELCRRGNRPWAVTSGGELMRRARAAGCPVFPVPEGYAPRAALGWMLVPAFSAVASDRADLRTRLRSAAVEVSAEMETWRSGRFESPRDPDEVGRRLAGRVAWVYGSDGAMSAVAYRWKTQIEENMKQFAVSGAFPEVAHNEIEGWAHGLSETPPLVVLLEGGAPGDLRSKGIAAAREEMDRLGLDSVVIPPFGQTPLVQFLSQIQFADLATLQGALHRGVDPDPVDALTRVKARIRGD